MSEKKRDFVAIARDYAKDVVAGRVLACQLVKQQCQRFLEDLGKQKSKDFPYRLDAAAATKVCRFVELMPHVKGKWARDRERIHLEPWQVFIDVNVFGWRRKKDGLRRYRRVYIEVPRKNAKSTHTAAIADYMLVEDGEHGAEVYSGATTEKQAWEVFGPARLMVKNTPELVDHYGVHVGAKNLNVPGTASKFEPIIGKPGDGASPSFSITDEYHEHASAEQYDTMVTGMGAREQPIAWVITTAGSDTSGPCYALRQQSIDMIERKVDHPELFAMIYTIDAGVDWTSELALRMANPNMGVSVFEDFLIGEQRRAVGDPREQSKFKTKHLNIWVTAAAPFFNAEKWRRLGDAPPIAEFLGARCVVGGDLASDLDLTAKVRLFTREVDGKRHYFAYGTFYLHEEATKAPENRHYEDWAARGHIVATPGQRTDHDYIEADLKKTADDHAVLLMAFDKYSAGQIITHMQNHLGADRVALVSQTVPELSPAMRKLEGLINAGQIHHDGNPCFAWMIGNVTAHEDRNENVFPRKEHPARKIDGVTALLNALSPAVDAAWDNGASVYEDRGILTL